MAEEAQIVNRIVVQGIDEAKAQVQSLKQLLSETKTAFEQARRSDDQRGMFQGSVKSADDLKGLINDIQLQIKRLNTEISQGDFSTREKALNEELKIRQRMAQQEQSLAEQMAKARETSMQRVRAQEEQMNASQVARMNSNATQEMQARQKVLDYESTVRQKLAQVQEQQSAKESLMGSIGTAGSQMSYTKQMSNLSANIEEQYRAFQRGSIGSTEYATALDKYTKGMSVARTEQEAFSKSIGTYTSAWDRMRARVESHASWIVAGGLIGAAIAIPGSVIESITRMDTAMAGVNQVMDHTNTASNAASKGISEQAEQQNMLNAESQKFLTIAAQYGESVTNIIEAGKLWGRTYKDINVVNTLTAQSAKLAVADNFSMVEANRAAESAMFQFGMTARNVTEALAYSGRVIDVWTKLAHNGGASAQDLSQGVERAGSAAHQTGADFEFLSAQVATGVRATGRSGAEIGNMLKTLYGSIHSDKAIAELDKLGISVYKIGEDGSKEFRKAQDVLLDLAVTAQGTNMSMEDVYKSAAGGKMQWSKAGATLGDYKEFIRTWGEAVDSIGFTDKQVGMQMDTISRRMQTLKTDVSSLAVSGGQAGIAGALKDSISAIDNFLMGLKQIPAWTIESAAGLAVAAKAFTILKDAIVATNIASAASRATPLGAALTVFGIAAVTATEALGGLANKQRETNREATDAIAVAQQQQQQLDKQVEFADALMGAHQKLQEQISNSTEGTEQYNRAVANQEETEKQLTRILGEDAVERIKDSSWSIDAYNQEKQAFEDGVAAKKKALQEMVDARILELETERDVIKTSIENYWKDADNFRDSLELKAKYLGWWKAVQMQYSEWKIGNAESGVKDLQSQIAEIDKQLSEGGDNELLSRRKEILQGQLEQEQANLESQQSSYQKAISAGTADLQQQKSDLDQQIIGLKQQSLNLAQVPEGLKIAPDLPSKGPKNAPADTSEQIQKKLDNYNVKSIEDQAAIAQSNYKARLDAITDATNRYGKSYAFLDATTATMSQHVNDLKATSAALTAQLQSDMGKINDLASETGATIEIAGGGTETERIINEMAAKYNVDPRLTQAIAQVESGKNQEAISSAGAIGVMQLMPDTAKGLGVNPYDLSGNIEGGVSYISSLLQEFGGDVEKAVAGYNAGGGAVEKYGGIPPYAETQEYVRKVLAEYNNPTSVSTGSQQVYVSGLSDTLAASGVSQASWQGMSADTKRQFIQDHKDQVKDANLLVGYLTQISGEQKKIAEYQKQITDETKKQYETLIKGIQDIESFQNRRAELSSRESLASLGYYATDSDKAVAAQRLTQSKLASSNAALAYAKSKGVDIFTDPTMSEERVKNLELQAQVQQQSTFATPEAQYKQRLAEIEYNQKLANVSLTGDLTSPYNTQAKHLNDLTAATDKVKALQELLKSMQESDVFANQTEEFKKYNLELKEAQKNAKELADTYSTKMRQGVYDVTNELLLQGKKISDIWGDLWKQLANDALKALLGIKNDSPGILAQALGIFGGAKSSTGKTSDASKYGDLLGVLGTTWGTGRDYKNPTASNLDTSKWNQFSNVLNTVEKGTSGLFSGKKSDTTSQSTGSTGVAWGSILGSIAGLFRANGGIADTPVVAGEDGEEVIIPVQKNTQNSASLLSYAAGKLGQKSLGITADFSSKDIAKTAMNVSVNSAANMAKTNAILVTQNQILTTMLNNMSSQQGQSTVIINAGGNNGQSMEDQASAYNTLVARRQIKV